MLFPKNLSSHENQLIENYGKASVIISLPLARECQLPILICAASLSARKKINWRHFHTESISFEQRVLQLQLKLIKIYKLADHDKPIKDRLSLIKYWQGWQNQMGSYYKPIHVVQRYEFMRASSGIVEEIMSIWDNSGSILFWVWAGFLSFGSIWWGLP